MAPLQPNNKKAKLQARGAQDDLKERREVRELQGLRAEIKQLEADLVVARASEQKGSGGAPGKEEIKELQRQLKLEKRQRMQLEEEAAARATNVVVAPTPAAVRNPDFEGVQAELKLARERIVLLTAQIESLKEESDTYRLRMNQVERELKLAAEKTTKCKKCELNGSESALDEADRIKAERTLRDRITALERERTTLVDDRTAGQKREAALKKKNDTLSLTVNTDQSKELVEQEELVMMYEVEIEEVREFLDNMSRKRCCSHHAGEETLMEKVEEIFGQFESLRDHVDNCAASKDSVKELTTTNAAQQASLRKANENVSKSDLRIRQLEMKVSETQKSLDDARRAVAGKPPTIPAAPITPPDTPPTTKPDIPTTKSDVPTIALAKYRELEQMHAAVNIALRNQKDKAKKNELAVAKAAQAAQPAKVVVEERIVEKVVEKIVERVVEKVVIKLVDRPVERAANGSEVPPSTTGPPPSVTEARLREAIKKMAATVSTLQGNIAALRDENTALLIDSINAF